MIEIGCLSCGKNMIFDGKHILDKGKTRLIKHHAIARNYADQCG
jgi:hypothetical protein